MKGHLRWLYKELPDWVAEEIITEDGANRLRVRYGESRAGGLSLGAMILTVLATLLIALGLILLLSYNWYDFTRTNRFMLSLALVMVSLLLVFYAIYKGPEKRALVEGAGIFHGLAFPGAYFLICAMYQLDSVAEWVFVLTASLLLLPIVYALGSVGLASIYVMLAAYFGTTTGNGNAWLGEQLTWVLLLGVVPFFLNLLRQGKNELEILWFSWICGMSVYYAFFVTMSPTEIVAVLIFSILGTLTYFIGEIFGKNRLWGLPFRALGWFGIIGSALYASFPSTWVYISEEVRVSFADVVVSVLLLAGLTALVWRAFKARKWQLFYVGLMPYLIAVGAVFATVGLGMTTTAVAVSLYFLGLTGIVLVKGIKAQKMSEINQGLLMFGLLLAARLFDFEYTMLERGITFILLGAIMLGVNLFVLYRRRQEENLQRIQVQKALREQQREEQQERLREAAENDKEAKDALRSRASSKMPPPLAESWSQLQGGFKNNKDVKSETNPSRTREDFAENSQVGDSYDD